MKEIGIGVIGGGYMGKAHSVAHAAVGAIFNTELRPRLEMIAATRDESAARYRDAYGFASSTGDWRELIANPKVDAVIIASPPETHLDIVSAAVERNMPIFCEKPLGTGLSDSAKMVGLVKDLPNMTGFNYIRTPASQYAKALIDAGEIGDITYFHGEHHEDYYADPNTPASWRTKGKTNGACGDLAHVFNMALRLMGPIEKLTAEIETVIKERPSPNGDGASVVENDDHGQFLCRFERGTMGHVSFSRIATGRKMGYAYEIFGTKGSIKFDGEDQNALWLYKSEGREAQLGYQKILMGPAHPDYLEFCQGAGHGTGYQDQIIIEAKDFLEAIATGKNHWCDFQAGHEVNRVVEAIFRSHDSGAWVNLSEIQ